MNHVSWQPESEWRVLTALSCLSRSSSAAMTPPRPIETKKGRPSSGTCIGCINSLDLSTVFPFSLVSPGKGLNPAFGSSSGTPPLVATSGPRLDSPITVLLSSNVAGILCVV